MMRLGIDLGGTRTKLGVVENGAVVAQDALDTRVQEGYEAVVERLAHQAQSLRAKYPDIQKVGIASPGLIDSAAGLVCYSNNFGWTDKSLRQDLAAALGIPVSIANDAHCATLGEALFGAGRGHERVAMLTIGTGVGGGFVKDGKLEKERYGAMAYILGHATLDTSGKQCNCGRRGCLEAYASASAIEHKSRRLFSGDISVREVFEAARSGNELARSVLREFMDTLAEGAVDVANILRPHVIVIGGGVSASWDLFLPTVNQRLEKSVYGYRYAPVHAVAAQLGNLAGVMGAAHL
jgi:glucokinase